jgi:hypothetical protein
MQGGGVAAKTTRHASEHADLCEVLRGYRLIARDLRRDRGQREVSTCWAIKHRFKDGAREPVRGASRDGYFHR